MWLHLLSNSSLQVAEMMFSPACNMVFDERSVALVSATSPLLYETIVVLLTLYRTMPAIIRQAGGPIIRNFLHSSILYYMYVLLYSAETTLFPT